MGRGLLQTTARWIWFCSLVLGSVGSPEFRYAQAAGILPALTGDAGYIMKAQANPPVNDVSGPTTQSSPPSSRGSALVGSSTTGGHTVRGGHFPSQPLNFPPDVNKGPGWTIPNGPYRPLPSAPPESAIVGAPAKSP